MATLLRSVILGAPPQYNTSTNFFKPSSSSFFVTFPNTSFCYPSNYSLHSNNSNCNLVSKFGSLPKFVTSANSSEEQVIESEEEQEAHQQQPDNLDSTDGAVNGETPEDSSNDADNADATPTSPTITALQLYKEALDNNDEAKIAEIVAFFKSIEDEKDALERKVLSLSEEFSVERERVLRISADFDNFRKRTERERLNLVTNAKGEVIENFLPVVDNFERAKTQIKIETEAEEKISNSYQSIYKQFFEIFSSIGVVPVETVGKPFDPMLHEAIMREDSTEYDEDIVIEEYRRGFKLGDRLLRPSMVKVSAGPGPEEPEASEPSVQEHGVTDTTDVIDDGDSADQTTS